VKTVTLFAAGKSAIQQSLYNSTPIRGVSIDNPTGSWLLLKSEQAYVPPYTIGWAMPLTYEQSSIDVVAGAGPSGQIATVALGNDKWSLTLDSDPVAQSEGSVTKLNTGFTPPVMTSVNGTTTSVLSGSSAYITPGTAGTRLRLKRVTVLQYSQILTGPCDSDCLFWLQHDGAGSQYIDSCVLEGVDSHTFDFGEGYDVPVGAGILWNAQPTFHNTFIGVYSTYEQI
jgi:hypothetical protein